jgi:hypothetical protein
MTQHNDLLEICSLHAVTSAGDRPPCPTVIR